MVIENCHMRNHVYEESVVLTHCRCSLVVNKWSLESALSPSDLTLMPFFDHKCLTKSVGKFAKIHSNTERCRQLDVARQLAEPLVEMITYKNKSGISHKGTKCRANNVSILQNNKEVAVTYELLDVHHETLEVMVLENNEVNDLLREIEMFPIVAHSNENIGIMDNLRGLIDFGRNNKRNYNRRG
ncbi:LOW QUALITY PROTEIN: hypothetical protein HID58_087765 [Brassica napus]|uniref:Uncharacterized protein n=1 Tax=Brassica napus TaxID=3708 RepID=A0ABQ7XU84_BRANA|nr:LOW QUALITY PROTEIN: hypothetical protein HID58_087765 [Brassica napus]